MLNWWRPVGEVYALTKELGAFRADDAIFVPCPGADHYLRVVVSDENRGCDTVNVELWLNDDSDGHHKQIAVSPEVAAHYIRRYLNLYPRKAGYSAFEEDDPVQLTRHPDGHVTELTQLGAR